MQDFKESNNMIRFIVKEFVVKEDFFLEGLHCERMKSKFTVPVVLAGRG